ncbi:SDR family oxidoreductase [Flavitalea sp. BT771]|uniref:SDR family oxidoreductase n=1 Tax=Flavitalea sp. BT771 TaxID=3063329 RepID=UPI0026E2B400|nr:SDR family oxidoreductase [Flavitalea sp. BT771]MDO6432765.1 SDR family oxidoreductase [Flavitalea sp. BT771]MDV6221959.1 SDR family oxidoreductase [Flavitalea sp. BT771]
MVLENKKVLIVGGSHGMGLGAARTAVRSGADVVIAGRDVEQLRLSKEVLGPKSRTICFDLTDATTYVGFFEAVGNFDHLFISASPGGESRFEAEYQNIQNSYLYGKFWHTFMFLQQAVRRINTGGSITLMSGGYAVRPHPDYTLVTVAFAATEGLARAMAVSLAPIRVNAIRPTYIDKEGNHTSIDKNLVGYQGTNGDIGHAVVFLMSNAYMTGQVLEIDGGASIKL